MLLKSIFFCLHIKSEQLTSWRRSSQVKRGRWSKICLHIHSRTNKNRYLMNKNVIYFEIPSYPKLVPKNVWPLIKVSEELLAYFPDYKQTQQPEREFLYSVLCTLMPNAVRELIANWVEKRSPATEEDKGDLIEITHDLKDSILAMFSMKSKWEGLSIIAQK